MTTKLIICDDSNMARKQMSRALPDNWQTEVSFAKNGEEAIELVKSGQFELMFLDLTMPVMDGYQTLEVIHKNDLPIMVIVVSGDIQPEARERVKKMGAIDFIKKPVDKEKVATVLRDYGLIGGEHA
ncbi:response regulator [Bermanella marisrubri]|uniref:Response regulator n=1 Tax=Bermanella marisrubri TaxID=207949 RepID=Q1N0K2_9GAMM|nr:response regulator [Bermanella marisrubri]EAT11831.1 response regulator [Oceanobacter sp. RED65] [Bermanella marisrubri]QIZ83865.1 response regulator [Bermanella marisrubri]